MMAANAAQFISLRDIVPGTDARPTVFDVSSDGSTIVGAYEGSHLFQLRLGVGLTTLVDSAGDPISGSVIAVSGDGRKILGRNALELGRTFLWTEGEELRYLDDLSTQQDKYAIPTDMSADGTVVVGNIVNFTAGERIGGFVWSQPTGLTIIPKHPAGNGGPLNAQAISDDGSTVVGSQAVAGVDDGSQSAGWRTVEQLVLGKSTAVLQGVLLACPPMDR